ncbi:MAG TPA: outer membrane lipoprotein-sorting protein [Candidatus Heimdallarchaeota archaeon]|nr:outer membrane lipoprotein-sorting protein [Candidatus Heimdallarchaeota archaeon]
MKRFAILLIVVTSVAASWIVGTAQINLSDEELLTAFDKARLFEETITGITVSIVAETPDETKEATTRLLFKTIGGEDFARIEFLVPEELAGQIYLSTPEATYFIGPDLDFPIKTSASTQLFGDAAVAQTSGIEFDGNYTIAERRDTTLEDGTPAIEVDLDAVDFTVAFQAVTLLAEAETLRPVAMTLYALSGLPFYEVFFESYATNGEDTYVEMQRIENQLLIGNQTHLEIVEITSEEFPDELFDPDRMGISG